MILVNTIFFFGNQICFLVRSKTVSIFFFWGFFGVQSFSSQTKDLNKISFIIIFGFGILMKYFFWGGGRLEHFEFKNAQNIVFKTRDLNKHFLTKIFQNFLLNFLGLGF